MMDNKNEKEIINALENFPLEEKIHLFNEVRTLETKIEKILKRITDLEEKVNAN